VELLRAAAAPLISAEGAAAAAAAAAARAAATARAAAAREAAAAAPSPTTAAGKKKAAAAALREATAAAAVAYGGGAPSFAPSPALRRIGDALGPLQVAYSRWLTDTSVPSHQVFSRLAPPATGAAALTSRINAALSRSDAVRAALAVAAPVGLAPAVQAAAAVPWAPGPGAPGCGPMPVPYGGGAGGYALTANFASSVDALKQSQPCSAFILAANMDVEAAALATLLDRLKEDECLKEEE
jgi:hypothetical protein